MLASVIFSMLLSSFALTAAALDCNQAPMCDCHMCNPVACIVHTEDGKSCKWPDSAEWCKSWIEEQCAVPAHRPGGGLGGLMGNGRLPLPGMLRPVPSKVKDDSSKDQASVVKSDSDRAIIKKVDCNHAPMCDCSSCNPEACIVHSDDGDSCMWPPSQDYCVKWKEDQCGSSHYGPGKHSGGGLGGLLAGGRLPLPGVGNLKPVKTTPWPVDTVEQQPAKEDTIRIVSCNHAPMCDCSTCNPEACIVHTSDGDSCMWPPSQNFCVQWKKEQCGGHRPIGRPGGGLGDLLAGGGLPFPGKGGLKPVKTTTAGPPKMLPGRLPGMGDLSGVSLKPVDRHTTSAATTQEPTGPQDKPMCKSFNLSKGCSNIHKKMCPKSCA